MYCSLLQLKEMHRKTNIFEGNFVACISSNQSIRTPSLICLSGLYVKYCTQNMSGNRNNDNSSDCFCGCVPPGPKQHRFVNVFRVGILQIITETVLLFVTLGYVYLYPPVGVWLLLSFLLTIIGVSIAICCCPSHTGWKSNFVMSAIAYTVRIILAIACIAIMSSTGSTKDKAVASRICK